MIVVRDTGYRAKFVMAVGWQWCCGGGVVSSGASHGRLSEKLDVPVIGRYWATGGVVDKRSGAKVSAGELVGLAGEVCVLRSPFC